MQILRCGKNPLRVRNLTTGTRLTQYDRAAKPAR